MSNRLKDLEDQKGINELLKKFIDIQSSRIDILEEYKKKLDKIFSRYQMTADSVEGVPFPEVEAKQ